MNMNSLRSSSRVFRNFSDPVLTSVFLILVGLVAGPGGGGDGSDIYLTICINN